MVGGGAEGHARLPRGDATPTHCEEGKPLTWDAPGVSVWRWNASDGADVRWSFGEWRPSPASSGTRYSLTVNAGVLKSTQPGGRIY